ncbi:hypothetical protein [Nocardia sienata]|uniref:hypothetical protein n=1 Tax=Nocardia sienata TaxID=248552 RepID=UPI0012ECBC68|nr:hypothetical protein [Nocardia sienata]
MECIADDSAGVVLPQVQQLPIGALQWDSHFSFRRAARCFDELAQRSDGSGELVSVSGQALRTEYEPGDDSDQEHFFERQTEHGVAPLFRR